MKKFLIGLTIALITFLCGVFISGIFRTEQKPISNPLIEKTVVDIPLFEVAPISKPKNIEVVEENDNQTIDGWYSLRNSKKIPELNGFMLYSGENNEDGTESEKNILSAMVFTEFGKDIDEGIVLSSWSEIKGNEIKFKTNKIKGNEYRFEGVFFKNKTMGEEGEELLRGTLQKFVKGKKVAEISGDFAYYQPQCWH